MDLAKSFEPAEIERRWYPFWESKGYFDAGRDATRPSFCVQLPPPNVTGGVVGRICQPTSARQNSGGTRGLLP